MRRFGPALVVLSLAFPLFAQPAVRPDAPGLNRCCTPRVYDRNDKLLGDVIRWDDRFPTVPLSAIVSYKLRDGDAVALVVSPDTIQGLQAPGGSVALFTTPDCSGPTMFAMIYQPPLMKRYAMVLPVGAPGTVHFAPTGAWLFVTDPFPARVNPAAGTVFHSQWGDNGECVPYPPPGYTVAPGPFGGYWMTRVEDLLKKYKRPFYQR